MEAGPHQLVAPFSPSLVKHENTHSVTESRLVGDPNGNIPQQSVAPGFPDGLLVADGLSSSNIHSFLSGDEEMAMVGRLEGGSIQATLIKGLLIKNGLVSRLILTDFLRCPGFKKN